MAIPLTILPRPVPQRPERQPQANIPQTRPERELIRQQTIDYVERVAPTPPLSQAELRTHAETFADQYGWDRRYVDYIGVLINNETWRETLATIPFERRLLLLPKCLRVEDRCPAPFDEFGLLCKRCGLCSIEELQDEAERLGYAVLVAEGSAIVMAIIQTGKIDAIVGVSCLNVLERAFPYMEAAAVPGVAIPLLQDDCKDTTIDLEWVWEVIHHTSEDKTRRLNLDTLRQEVESWFTPESLEAILGPSEGATDDMARTWLAGAGKRWRPFLTACVYKALQSDSEAPLPDGLRKIAVAVECFHKASLIHDDIEDADAQRYGEKTLHEQFGVPIALNLGDLLLGEGYRLLAESDAAPAARARLLKIAAQGHRTLCLGQGAELAWMRNPETLTPLQVANIFRQKTSPAFEVALQLGAAYAEADDAIHEVLANYSLALGIAYQIQDDLHDLASESEPSDLSALRPSMPLAIARERAKAPEVKALLEAAWKRDSRLDTAALARQITELGADTRSRDLMESYKDEAIRSLVELENASLKGLLRRVIGKLFQVEVKGWCSEFEARNAPGGAPSAPPAG
ncbi:polyprenyl synthetase family protein [Armatimonas rosea]|uniref:Geranylgeranyl pyrophosphate synthase n=1 Tax=Armatimonas rosea TaxID=685828 RepID=A0A7W9W506_ARMRO|nr:polyprenyl synthetase family protein [Armatimonas rosea]MBB6048541.1 geranylgeranyl pyrophosphate synthase [Armatimonas rosea]